MRRTERSRFGGDGQASAAAHERLIDLLEQGDGEGTAEVALELWGSLSTRG